MNGIRESLRIRGLSDSGDEFASENHTHFYPTSRLSYRSRLRVLSVQKEHLKFDLEMFEFTAMDGFHERHRGIDEQ